LDPIVCGITSTGRNPRWNLDDRETKRSYVSNSLDRDEIGLALKLDLHRSKSSVPQKPVPVVKSQIKRLPWNRFTSEVSYLLSPEMFTKADPIHYLMEKTLQLSYSRIFSIDENLQYFLKLKNKFPAHYAPYAKFVAQVVRCRRDLEQVKQSIIEIRHSIALDLHSLPSVGFWTIELPALFSSDIFSDIYPPLKLMVELMDMPEDKITELKSQLANLLKNDQLPELYFRYAKELQTFILNRFALRGLRQSVAELRDILAADSSSDSDQITNNASLVSEKVPVSAA
ncbi:hypothetical protein U1Q18_050923, partial [Sarracenia purpurea var. burkii]